jgi:predicted nucleic acid-binding protein
MIVLVDTDVLIDLALDRAPHSHRASELLDALELRPGTGFVAWHSVSNFYYLVAPSRGRESARTFLVDLAKFIEVSPTTTDSLRFATGLNMKDFEDAMQVAAAAACRADVIATRNLRDYANAPVRVAKPESIVDEL